MFLKKTSYERALTAMRRKAQSTIDIKQMSTLLRGIGSELQELGQRMINFLKYEILCILIGFFFG